MSKEQFFYKLSDQAQGISRDLAPGLKTRIFPGDQAMLSIVTIAPNAEGQLHNHPEEQWGVMLEGSGVRTQGGEEVNVRKGDFWRTPANLPHRFKAGSKGALILDIFSPPREEYRKPGSGFSKD